MSTRTWIAMLVLGAGALIAAAASAGALSSRADDPQVDSTDRETRSVAAFTTVARVLRHPRCLNCHPSGDVPRVGDDRRLHAMNVQRGPDGQGAAGLHCGACHQPRNQALAGVPGAPHWRLAPRAMAWEGLDDHALAEQLKDRSRNGDRTFADLLAHMAEDPLVAWGWDPGPGRAAVPISHAAFVEALETWIDNGAVSPPPGMTTY